ncbi:M14 family metallopeptidase [Fulvivirgaceae bacterium BMA10]|uniref:M14 family metallopeptidase n=1 Tax=Splendidivirga corallicola TaxID=3051826 RepID=A0ABT8KQG0_9BACT|nr:M14 family metallopeptidase [Fulvivirgaceae bacterium BMA10]
MINPARSILETTVSFFIFITFCSSSMGQDPYFFYQKTNFDQSIPTPEEYLGYSVGTHHTRHDQIVSYFKALDESSEKVSFQEIGRTYEHRPLIVLTITSQENHQKLDEIRRQHLELCDPKQTSPDVSKMPIIIHLGYNVHGNEPSSSEAAMLTAYYLAAAQSDEVKNYLDKAIIFIDPVFNPDGRDRHSNWANMHKGSPLVSDPLDREHNEVWPGGRTNHYWYDLNRDWLPLAHVESKARIEFFHQWLPNVLTDFHEMGTNNTYFFEPTKPFGSENPVVPRDNYDKLNSLLAKYFVKALDNIGSLYFTKEVFDNSYPGYGSTYPDIHGGLGLVFEQASSRGHLQKSSTGELSFRFTIRNHFTSSLATVEGAVAEKDVFLQHQRDFFTSAITESRKNPVKGYVFGDLHDQNRNKAFLDLLLRHRIDCYEVPQTLRLNGKTFEKGSAFIVPTEQAQYRMVRTMFEKVTQFHDSIFYDASAWALVYAYGLPFESLTGKSLDFGKKVIRENLSGIDAEVRKSKYAYLIDWKDYYAPNALNHLLKAEIVVKAAFKPLNIKLNDGSTKDFGYGTLMIPAIQEKVDSETLYKTLLEVARESKVKIFSVETGFSNTGIDLGSGNFRTIKVPKVIMPIGEGVSSYEAGEVWHLLDSKVGMPVTKVDLVDFGWVDLHDYSTLVMVSGSYSLFDDKMVERIKEWVKAGGTLVTLRAATSWAINKKIVDEKLRKKEASEEEPKRLDYVSAGNVRGADQIGGSIYATDLDITHPLGFGYSNRELAIYRNSKVILEPSKNPFSTVIKYTKDPLISGYISKGNLDQLKNSASLIVSSLGRGKVILFADNPNFRGTWYGTNKLFLNALFFGEHIRTP